MPLVPGDQPGHWELRELRVPAVLRARPVTRDQSVTLDRSVRRERRDRQARQEYRVRQGNGGCKGRLAIRARPELSVGRGRRATRALSEQLDW